jgi:hypothetical protein
MPVESPEGHNCSMLPVIGFGLHDGHIDGQTLCRMFNDATAYADVACQ